MNNKSKSNSINEIIDMIDDVENRGAYFEVERRKEEIKNVSLMPGGVSQSEIILFEGGEDLPFNERQAPKRKDTEETVQLSSDSDSDYVGGCALDDNSNGSGETEHVAMQKEAFQRSRCCNPSISCCKRCSLITITIIIIAGLSLLAAIFLGALVEACDVAKASDTLDLYDQNAVCALEEVTQTMSTFASSQDANAADLPIAHCGTCGGCSSVQDITIYAKTRYSLTLDATKCALKSFISMDLVSKCFDEKVGFTPACRDCWIENIDCTKKRCKWTCLKFKMLGGSNNDGDDLNQCLQCDERLCGPQFLECAGANRRQSGIVSAIGRDAENEQCHSVDIDWVGTLDE